MYEIKTIMTTDVIHVKRQTPINNVMLTMVANGVSGLPVVNEDMTLAGIISEKDVLKLFRNMKQNIQTAEDFMTTPVYSFDQNDNLIDVCNSLISNHFRRVPITANGKLIGIITRKDILKYIVNYQGFFRDVPQIKMEAYY